MTQELFSTSVPAGLEPGRSGFCTVAMTRGIARPLIELLEALSAYRPVYMPGDARAVNNPAALSHLRVSAGGKTYTIVSRVCAAGLDYTNRSNRFAHHVILDTVDARPTGGPGWLASRPGFLEPKWDGKVAWLGQGRSVPAAGDVTPGSTTWKRLTGDAGWAGVLAEAMLQEGGKPYYLVFDPGTELLPLIAEAIALLPVEKRWGVTFTTYFAGLPQGVTCQIRGVVRGSPEVQTLAAGSMLDLASLSGRQAPSSVFVEAARAGKVVPASALPGGQAPAWLSPRETGKGGGDRGGSGVVMPGIFASKGEPSAPVEEPPPPPESAPLPGRSFTGVLVGVSLGVALLAGSFGLALALYPDLFRGTHARHHGPENGSAGEKGKDDDREKPEKLEVGKLHLDMLTKSPRFGEPIDFQVTLEKKPAAFPWRKLKLTLDGKEAELPAAEELAPGRARFRLDAPLPGKHEIQLTFPGEDRFEPATPAKADLNVDRMRLVLKASCQTRGPLEPGPGRLVVQVAIEQAAFLARHRLLAQVPWNEAEFTFQRKPLSPVPGSKDGRYELQAVLEPGKDTLRLRFPKKQQPAFDLPGEIRVADLDVLRWPVQVEVTAIPKFFGTGSVLINAQVRSSRPGLPVPGGKVQLLQGSKVLAEEVIHKGLARFRLVRTLPRGWHALKLVYQGDGLYRPAETSAKVLVVQEIDYDRLKLEAKKTEPTEWAFQSVTGAHFLTLDELPVEDLAAKKEIIKQKMANWEKDRKRQLEIRAGGDEAKLKVIPRIMDMERPRKQADLEKLVDPPMFEYYLRFLPVERKEEDRLDRLSAREVGIGNGGRRLTIDWIHRVKDREVHNVPLMALRLLRETKKVGETTQIQYVIRHDLFNWKPREADGKPEQAVQKFRTAVSDLHGLLIEVHRLPPRKPASEDKKDPPEEDNKDLPKGESKEPKKDPPREPDREKKAPPGDPPKEESIPILLIRTKRS